MSFVQSCSSPSRSLRDNNIFVMSGGYHLLAFWSSHMLVLTKMSTCALQLYFTPA